MYEFMLQPENLYFSIALGLMLGIAFLEGITALFGFALSGIVDSLLHLDVDMDADFSIDLEADNALSKMFSWLRIGKVPVIMLLIVFLTSFSLIGYGVQSLSQDIFGTLMYAWLACIIAFIISIPILKFFAGLISRVLPKDETDAVSTDTFIGRVAVLTTVDAVQGRTVEARLSDEHGNTHYIMIEPDGDFTIPAKTKALLLSKNGNVFKAIKFTEPT